jgi:hypothetical protein
MMHEATAANERFLSARHRKVLEEESRISPEVIEARGYRTAETRDELEADPGIKTNQHHAPALVLPVYGIDDKYRYSRVRPDNPPSDMSKYIQPGGTPNVLDVPRPVLDKVLERETLLVITEGEKKADYLASLGVAVVCLFGVWNWSHKMSKDTPYEKQVLLEDFDELPLRGREVALMFDCDTMTNTNIQLAAYRLANKLRGRGALL